MCLTVRLLLDTLLWECISSNAFACRLLMDRSLGLSDVKDVHPEVHDSLRKLLAYEGNMEEMGLFFQVCTTTATPAQCQAAPIQARSWCTFLVQHSAVAAPAVHSTFTLPLIEVGARV